MFKIADITYELISDCPEAIDRITSFTTFDELPVDVTFRVMKNENMGLIDNGLKPILLEDAIWRIGENEFSIDTVATGKLASRLVSIEAGKVNELEYRNLEKENNYTTAENMLGIHHRIHILNHNGFVLHGSAINHKGDGIVFSAPSGTGKTTHTTMWEDHKSAHVINDDTPSIRIMDDGVYVYGTPWSGSSSKFTNEKLPLKAIVMLEQAPENRIKRLTGLMAVKALMPRVFLPYHDEKLMPVAIDIIGKCIESTPIFMLSCTPELEAVDLVEYELSKLSV